MYSVDAATAGVSVVAAADVDAVDTCESAPVQAQRCHTETERTTIFAAVVATVACCSQRLEAEAAAAAVES